jgi:hypothetical protein
VSLISTTYAEMIRSKCMGNSDNLRSVLLPLITHFMSKGNSVLDMMHEPSILILKLKTFNHYTFNMSLFKKIIMIQWSGKKLIKLVDTDLLGFSVSHIKLG